MARMGIIGLVRIDLPGGTTLRLSEGMAIRWGSETYAPRHATYGALAGIDALEEGLGNEVPMMPLKLRPPSTTSAAALVQPGAQRARVRAWAAEYDADAGTIVGTPETQFDGFLDRAELVRSRDALDLNFSVVSWLEHLFELNIGNSLTAGFHKSVWPGETGEDHATGLTIPDAWGVEAPPQNTASVAPGGDYGRWNSYWSGPA